MDDNDIRLKMQEVVEAVKHGLSSIRTGRATPSLVQDIVVTTYGGAQKLRILELASITTPDSRSILVSPWDKSTASDIERAIKAANIGLTPIADPDVIRINLPSLTAEDKQNYVKILHQKLENGRISFRRVRQEAMDEIKKAFGEKEFGEDEKFRREERVQKLTDEYVGKIDELGEQKETELMAV